MGGEREVTDAGSRASGWPVIVLVEPSAIDVVWAIIRCAGLAEQAAAGWKVPETPWDLTSAGLLRIGDAGSEHGGHVTELAVRGVGLVVALPEETAVADRYADALERIGSVDDWRSSPVLALDPRAVEVLCALGAGATTSAAARAAHLSERSAHRLLSDARDRLGAPTNVEAVRQVNALVRRFRI